jgi:hypothetical protein
LSHSSPNGFRREQQSFFKPVAPCAFWKGERSL